MKVSKEILKQIIAEEIDNVLNEQAPVLRLGDVGDRNFKKWKQKILSVIKKDLAAGDSPLEIANSLHDYHVSDKYTKTVYDRFHVGDHVRAEEWIKNTISKLRKKGDGITGKGTFTAKPVKAKKKSRWKVCDDFPLVKFCKGRHVQMLQRLVNNVNEKLGLERGTKEDAYYGKYTAKALKDLKKTLGIRPADGNIFTEQDFDRLKQELTRVPPGQTGQIFHKGGLGEPVEKAMMPALANKSRLNLAKKMLKKKPGSPENK